MGSERDSRVLDLSLALDRAWATARPIPAPTGDWPEMSIDDAYAVQEQLIESRIGRGRRRAGWKMGLTSSAGGPGPIVGTLLDDMVLASEAQLSAATMVGPMVEAELAFVAGDDVEPGAGIEGLRSGPHRVAPAIEVIDYRTVGSSGPVDWVADNSTVAYAVLGDQVAVSLAQPLADIRAVLRTDRGVLAEGRGSSVMGDPLQAVAWLVEHLGRRGRHLTAGDVVLTGSLTGHHAVHPPSRLEADFDSLGCVGVSFAD